MNRLALLLLAFLIAAPAQAVPRYWVSPTGTNTSWEDSNVVKVGANAKNLAWVNANAMAGHIYILTAGTYNVPIAPADNRNGTASNRIRFYGNMAHPESVVVAGIHLGPDPWSSPARYAECGSYCTVRWISSSTTVDGVRAKYSVYAHHDSLIRIIGSNQSDEFSLHSVSSVADSCSISGTITASGQPNFVGISGERLHDSSCWDYATDPDGGCPWWYPSNNKIVNSTFTCTFNQVVGDGHAIFLNQCYGNTINNNVFNITFVRNSNYFFGIEGYQSYFTQIQGNAFNVVMSGQPTGSHAVLSWRDSSQSNRFMNNTVTVSGSGGDMDFFQNNGGHYGSVGLMKNYYGGNTLVVPSPKDNLFRYYGVDAQVDTVEFNTMVSNNTKKILAITNGGAAKGLVVRHNTFYGLGGSVVDLGSVTATNGTRLVSNIYYGGSANGAGGETIRVPTGTDIDSAGVFYSVGGSNTRAIYKGGVASAPPGLPSLWADPLFLYAPSNLHLQTGSPAITGSSVWDGYAGAYGPDGSTAHYTITAGPTLAGYGEIQPASASVEDGGSKTFYVVPQTGYHITDVKVDGSSVGAVSSYQFTSVSAAHTIQAAFGINTYTIYAYAGPGGTINPSSTASVDYGESPVYAITPSGGYSIAAVLVDDEVAKLSPSNTYPFGPVSSSHTIEAFFVPAVDSVAVLATSSSGGSITPPGVTNYLAGVDTPEYTISPYPGWFVSGFLVNGAEANPADYTHDGSNLIYTFNSLGAPPGGQSAHSIEGVFLADSVSIIATTSAPSAITNSGVLRTTSGATASYLIATPPGYFFKNLIVDGVDVGTRLDYTLRNITTPHTISATFWRFP